VDSSQVKEFARECGADVVGIADLARLKGIHTEPADLLEGYVRAVSIAVRLADGIIDPIRDRPTAIYQQHYGKVNALLDDIALRVSQLLQEAGGRALPIPASQVLDKTEWYSYISHKAVAVAAGVGWQGKSLLVVHPQYGPRIRLVTILTDLPLVADEPLKNKCGKCSSCTDACPVQAIKNVNTTSHYEDRNQALHFDACVERVLDNAAHVPFVESPICGVCIRACPRGRKKKSTKVDAQRISTKSAP